MRFLNMFVTVIVVSLLCTSAAVANEYRPEPKEYKVSCYGSYLSIPYDDFAILTGNSAALRFYSPYFPPQTKTLTITAPSELPEPFVQKLVQRWAGKAESFIQDYGRKGFMNWGAPPWQELLPVRDGPRVSERVWYSVGGEKVLRIWHAELLEFRRAPLPGWINRLGGVVSGRACYTIRVYSPGYYTAVLDSYKDAVSQQ
ncbi:MAG: hypothetical protein AB1374_07000 [Bacillota bacterium]